jgi:HlyD family secretion protein
VLGATMAITCDNCPGDLQGRIVFISREAEFTPPVIFSEQERAKLVFRVEAKPNGDWSLPIGLPVTVTPQDAARKP